MSRMQQGESKGHFHLPDLGGTRGSSREAPLMPGQRGGGGTQRQGSFAWRDKLLTCSLPLPYRVCHRMLLLIWSESCSVLPESPVGTHGFTRPTASPLEKNQ